MPATEISLAVDRGVSAPERRMLQMLAFLGGFTDTAGFIVLFGLFTAHVTGNIVIGASNLVQDGGRGALSKLLMIPLFLAAVVASTLVIDFVRARWARRELTVMLALETALLAAFFAAALVLDPRHAAPDGWPVIAVGGVGVLAMGVQNTMMREISVVALLPTTMMTGNTAQTTIAVVRWVRARHRGDAEMRRIAANRLRVFAPAFAAFVLGATLAAAGVLKTGYWCLLVPVAVAIGAAALSLKLRTGAPSRPAATGAGPGPAAGKAAP